MEGRALTDKDVQRAIDAIGASTNDPDQLISRINAVQKNLVRGLKIEAREKKFDWEPIPEYKPKGEPKEITSQEEYDSLPSGAVYFEDGERYRKP